MTKSRAALAALAVTGFAMAGCGYTPGERALSGGVIGAGAGAAVSGVSGGNIGTGAAVGAAGGAIAGAATTPRR